ncbi:alkaline phosphatase family protein [Lacihabitans sp. LS3-19]|uniref:alkaline phosphatase PafA n=1 Tax=Lacihabitans sp. LS3-19 TaxID=2487335 RepID=UPI0020CB96FA|nr:alkaline phosphatase PafA [Lacihabitans sp. LS3-19]MCP9770045.1 alkaline phosphatase family protein [Lacihabitans sp. LS3-19]
MKLKLLGLLMLCFLATQAQKPKAEKPKLVVGIVVDQMRYDYLYRFYSKYTAGGLKRLMTEGYNCRNNQYHYASTVTGPGHAHIFNGSSPAISGIVGNEWYDKTIGKTTYVVSDSTANVVGLGSATAGKMSPRNMKVSSITDQLRIASQFQSKVIGVAIKDRGAILPAGHTGQAYWYDAGSANWITSDFYLKQLPAWVNSFNDKKIAQELVSKPWETMMPLDKYTETEEDDQPYEATMSGEPKAVFPHKVTLGGIATSPYGNDLTLKFGLAAIDGENLGMGQQTDFLTLSFSSPDYVGHSFGAQSKEIEDVYLKLDKNIAELLSHLDKKLGIGNYTVFLSADHGVAEIPAFLKKHNVPSGLFLGGELEKKAEAALGAKFGEGKYILSADNYQMYLNMDLLNQKSISVDQVTQTLKTEFLKTEGIYNVINLSEGKANDVPQVFRDKLTNIYNPKRSGEVMVLVEPGWFAGYVKGTTHGTMYPYDTHVPLLFYGWGINKGENLNITHISDIAPTIAMLLKILEPNGSIGSPITSALK